MNRATALYLTAAILTSTTASAIVLPESTETRTFAQFNQVVNNRPIVFDPLNSSLALFGTLDHPLGVAVEFSFIDLTFPELPAELLGPQSAWMTIHSETSIHATGTAPRFDQPIEWGFIEFRRTEPLADGRDLLLRVDFTNALLRTNVRTGSVDAAEYEVTLCSGSCVLINYSSQFLFFDDSPEDNWAVALSSINPPVLALDGTGFLTYFQANGVGTFDGNPTGVIPEPASFALGAGLLGLFAGCFRRRGSSAVGLRKAA